MTFDHVYIVFRAFPWKSLRRVFQRQIAGLAVSPPNARIKYYVDF